MAEKRLFLLDGNALIYRAHFAFIGRPLINSKGMNTSAITGFVRTLWDLMQNSNPTHIAVSFDLKGPTFRNELYSEYKANRDEQPEDITKAIPYVYDIVKAFNIPILTMENFEADDVIGTIAKKAEKEGFKVYMVTPDKDYAQLVSDNVFMYKPSRQGNGVEILGEKEILEQWEIERVEQVIDVLGLQGDSSDNIPGIPGIGPKTAKKLLKQFNSVEGLIENADQLKGKQRENVIKFARQALLSKKLATIDIDVPLDFDAKSVEIEPFDREKLSAIFKELEFRSLARSILGDGPQKQEEAVQGSLFPSASEKAQADISPDLEDHSVAERTIEQVEVNYQLARSEQEISALIRLLSGVKGFAFDSETTGLNPHLAQLVGLSFSIEPQQGYYVPFPADQVEASKLLEKFRELLESEKTAKIGQNIKYDALVLRKYGIRLGGFFYDTMIMHYLLEPGMRHNMDFLAETYLKYKPISIETLIGKKGKSQRSMRDVDPEKAMIYACEDADITLQLKLYFEKKLEEEGLRELYNLIEEPLVDAIIEMEATGVKLDKDQLKKYSAELEEKIDAMASDIHAEVGVNFNIDSPKQVGEVLFDQLKIPYTWRKTKSGQYSTNEEKLSELSKDHDIAAKILTYRGLTKLKSTYVDALPGLINPRTGRIHSSFNQALTATGRLSSNNPNLQNIPIRTAEGRRVREAFVPTGPDHILLAADYSQIELRLIAEISGDEAMLDAFLKDQDIHRATAAKVYGTPYEEVTDDQRRNAKTVNFSIIYGAGSTNLSRQLNISRKEAGELINQYFNQYSGLKKYMDETVEFARKNGYVSTLMKRRRFLRDINSRNGMMRSQAERMAINTPIQGTAADMIKKAMIDLHEFLQKEGLESKIIMQVHDELVLDALKSEEQKLLPVIEEKMKNALPGLKVPIKVEIGRGENWLQAH
ncbi:MAG: DNA polymerase I [Saprospirales bacterium]|nr:MAG: DNA polymerase I [Saprospirales bacterium]